MFTILESEDNKPFKVKGIALRKNAISKNGYRYSDKLVENVVNTIKNYISRNGSYPITMMADHPNFSSNKTLSVIGKITDIYLDGDNAIIESEIANTTVGKDVQELIRGKFVEGLSIRASNAKYKAMNIGGKKVKDVLEMDLKGVDLVVNPGVDGARITDIIESDQTGSNNLYISINESEEILDIKEGENKLDLKELKSKYPELVESLKEEFKTIMESEGKLSELQESLNEYTQENEKLKSSVKEFETKIEESEKTIQDLTTKLEESENKLKTIEEEAASAERKAHIESELAKLKFADSVKEKIRKKLEVLESKEEITSVLEEEVEFLKTVIKESTGVELTGKGYTGDNHSEDLTEEEKFIDLVNKL